VDPTFDHGIDTVRPMSSVVEGRIVDAMTSTRSCRTLLRLTGVLLAGAALVGCGTVGVPAAGNAPSAQGGSSSATTEEAASGSSSTPGAEQPPATGLDPGLTAAFEQASSAAAAEGRALVINSGHRTPERQQELLDEAVVEHGSLEAASRWVFSPETSMHVQGLAIDVGDGPAADWLDVNGERWGLCRTLDWEWWHFEWRQAWADDRACPAPVFDPADAPGR
jgi:D-alanyl-D-alanine carboxypeptidase